MMQYLFIADGRESPGEPQEAPVGLQESFAQRPLCGGQEESGQPDQRAGKVGQLESCHAEISC